MNWSFLFFLSKPWFVVPWYAIGAMGVWYVIYDMRNKNTVLKPAMKWAWPIIVFFFSVIGLALYFTTARAPGIDQMKSEEEKQKAHNEYEQNPWRRVNGAVIHCVAGDGFGIMTAMVIARAAGMSFWQEFWFEYIVGFAIGWFIFQRKSMTMMTDNLAKQLGMAFRGEFFSMLTVMAGMGCVMTYITPLVTTAQPKPLTSTFWGFGMLGLLVGYIFTFPMNWMMVKLGWKHGLGDMEGAKKMQIQGMAKKVGVVAAMVVLGFGALLLTAWLTDVRQGASIAHEEAALTPSIQTNVGQALYTGVNESIEKARQGIQKGNRTEASLAMDDAMRAAEVGAHSAPGSFYSALEQIRSARIALQQGNDSLASRHLGEAAQVLRPASNATPPILDVSRYNGAEVIDQKGTVIGEVNSVSGNTLDLVLGGWRDAWGFIDFSGKRHVKVSADSLAFGPPNAIGYKMVAIPTGATTTAQR